MMKKSPIVILTVLFLFVFTVCVFSAPLIAGDFTKSTPKDTTLLFSAQDFIGNSTPPDGASLTKVKFDQVTNAASGTLFIGKNALLKGSTVSVNDLNRLTFVPKVGFEGEGIFTWTAIYSKGQSPFPGAVVITVGSGNGAPSEIAKPTESAETKKEPQTTKAPEKEKKQEKASVKKQETKKETNDAVKVQNETSKASQGLKPLRYEDMLTHWGAYSAGMLGARGYVIGEDYGNLFYFRPDENITRFEFVLMVNAIFGVKPDDDSISKNPFSDKNAPAYMLRVGSAAHEYDIIEGNKGKDGKLYFYPKDPITRAEAITIIDYALRLDSYGVDTAEFTDFSSVPDWAKESVKNLEAYGIIQGYEDGSLRPNVQITRAQAAEMVWQALKFLDLKRETSAVFQTVLYGD